MPLETMASAATRTSVPVTFHAKWFQLCQPIGGVAATGVSAVTGAVMNMVARASERTSERMRHAPLVGGAAMNCALSRLQQRWQARVPVLQ